MKKPEPTPAMPKTIGTIDDDIRRVIDTFKGTKGYTTHSEALEKLIMRAEKMNLHRLTDDEFDALLHAESVR